MNNLAYAIINDFLRCRYVNETEELNEKQLDLLNKFVDDSYALVTKEDMAIVANYVTFKEYILDVLKDNNLSFSDKRCYSYFVDSVKLIINANIDYYIAEK